HLAFYKTLAEELIRQYPRADVRPIRRLVEANGYSDTILCRYQAPLEEAPFEAESIDIVFSNAVIEHLYDLRGALRHLHRIPRRRGIGLHQVDHRDHRDFSRPLEYLTLSENDFQKEFARSHGECGNRWRPEEVADAFLGAGFEVIDFTA